MLIHTLHDNYSLNVVSHAQTNYKTIALTVFSRWYQ
jgi:hypothetical protein